ncbi:bacillithiol biosynthesis cysteine-adding enzyme BshC [Fictibacillus phosphorivorans]|uniref:bacillithiol biosynthesis cysteine-adding enzyme BshC n=1 Tax=Fictibacillus phosphorivorans TaxID=1221500 RepID=UPI00203E0E97|nr:bacillithiol biosynthesis cysteine-adding enzyme BshC [Fictibacillus phosphorivorans]MCM3717263.1 bacillithiol biosynthesis cysteine-adding enzyme BshC [Fictibacillus phosphorivorans]MCM3774950.1 bacillithiol biosynthesis cysteine-adding enzyme BshC [Fictibacillus phosphorivorans]
MRLEEIKLQTSPFLEKYVNGDEDAVGFFDYKEPFNRSALSMRQQELKQYTFPRNDLTEYLDSYNHRIGTSDQTRNNIDKLKNSDGLAVVGGQQAGLLSGPLLVIYKCISTIQLAKQAERELGVPVAPVFWIAGEDHDMDEINHVRVPKNDTAKKISLKAATSVKSSASLWEWNPDDVKPWLHYVFRSFGETAFTNDFLAQTERLLYESDSIVTFFAKLLSNWFSKEGLILLDAGDPAFKKLQSKFLERMIRNNVNIDHAFKTQTKNLNEAGFTDPIEVQENNAHLFYTKNGERILLFRNGNGFTSKEEDFSISEEELLREAKRSPEKFSNNVVTRPLMQEFLLPTLSFIAGPGEISYWASLGKIFHHFERKMPVLMPRLSITLVSGRINSLLSSKELKVEQVLEEGTDKYKRNWFNVNRPVETNDSIEAVRSDIVKSYSQLVKLAEEIDPKLLPVTEQNLNRILSEVSYIEHKMEQRVRQKVKVPLAEFDEIMLELKPGGVLQERVWNVYQYLNEEGSDLIKDLLEYPYCFNEKHKIVYL